MDSFKNFQNIKTEKAKAMGKYRKMQKVTAFLKLIELFIFMSVLSKITTIFPIAFKLSGDYMKEFFIILITPRFVFIVLNLIVFTLFWKSGQLSNQEFSNKNTAKPDFYDEYVKSCQRNPKDGIFTEKQSIQKQRKEKIVVCRDVVIAESDCMAVKKMQRSQSERLKNTDCEFNKEKNCPALRRSVTEKCLKMRNNELVAVDEMSNEDFRLRVEAFIARQQRFLKEEDEEE